MDYVERTLSAYNDHPQKFEAASRNRVPIAEIEEFINLLPTRELPVLDAGCGFGRDTSKLAEYGLKVVGIDMSNKLLERARQLCDFLDFKEMDVRRLNFDDNSFSGIWCLATLLHLKDTDVMTALAEFKRVLIPNGAFFITLKEGSGEEEIIDSFSSNGARYYNYQTVQTAQNLIEGSGLQVTRLYKINERQRWGADQRDLDWLYIFGCK